MTVPVNTSAHAPSGIARDKWPRFICVLAVAAFFGIATFGQLLPINSHYYFQWSWQWIPSSIVYPILLPLAIPFAIGQIIYLRNPNRIWQALTVILIAKAALMLGAAAIENKPPGLDRISNVIQSRLTTGYFDEAAIQIHRGTSVHEILSQYPRLLSHFYLHARQKPPGPILFETAMIHIFGPTKAGAMASGLIIGIVATFTVWAVYAFILFFTGNRHAAFTGASYFTLCPGPILFFPQFDICYPILTLAITVLWAQALRTDRVQYSAALGLLFAATSMFTLIVGVLPIFLTGYAALLYWSDPKCGIARICKHVAISIALFIAAHLAFWAMTGFNPVATLRACIAQERFIFNVLVEQYHFPRTHLPLTFFTDLYDFALGSGWISFLLAIFYFISAKKSGLTPEMRIALVCVAQFVVVAMTGLLVTETSRIWQFMLPMLMVPLGLELANWRPWQRMTVYAVLFLLTIVMCQSMQFISSAI